MKMKVSTSRTMSRPALYLCLTVLCWYCCVVVCNEDKGIDIEDDVSASSVPLSHSVVCWYCCIVVCNEDEGIDIEDDVSASSVPLSHSVNDDFSVAGRCVPSSPLTDGHSTVSCTQLTALAKLCLQSLDWLLWITSLIQWFWTWLCICVPQNLFMCFFLFFVCVKTVNKSYVCIVLAIFNILLLCSFSSGFWNIYDTDCRYNK